MNFSSKLLEEAVAEVARLPGIGEKTALRMVLFLLNRPEQEVERFAGALLKLKKEVNFCSECGNISDAPLCSICTAPKRDRSLICVVEDSRDVMAIENTRQYKGLYHVLGGLISPMDGIGPSDLHIGKLLERAGKGEAKEIILALSATMEGDTTVFYLYKKLKDIPVLLSSIARGIAFGGEIEYADEVTLGRSIQTRVPYKGEA
ncbi:DNA replication and repair protein RecR [Anseongella ginsenosidimutans]|uniref:Recombination protein RecR n=1 Tax=Anseongella ginsenosidimutans TaxID=496056 RepID=A0A4R3KT44_9SPHI|nr:recombination mediator RecR [Anseongella ginsenosidimutans]QEC53294.1 recombination protein RecR [Anseongella ginsenosidimutans]TCS88167.1 DNA replication and repair protein RecR [Anseongella ginsenosidimutans]